MKLVHALLAVVAVVAATATTANAQATTTTTTVGAPCPRQTNASGAPAGAPAPAAWLPVVTGPIFGGTVGAPVPAPAPAPVSQAPQAPPPAVVVVTQTVIAQPQPQPTNQVPPTQVPNQVPEPSPFPSPNAVGAVVDRSVPPATTVAPSLPTTTTPTPTINDQQPPPFGSVVNRDMPIGGGGNGMGGGNGQYFVNEEAFTSVYGVLLHGRHWHYQPWNGDYVGCPEGFPDLQRGLCYQACPDQFWGAGPVCWQGARSHPRGVGRVPVYQRDVPQ